MVPTEPFLPAASKAEAVARIYALAGVTPEALGPGSTEKKSVLVELARRLDLPVDSQAAKPALGAQVAGALGADWPPAAWSSGSTITLYGLNTLLEAATFELHRRAFLSTPEDLLAGQLEFGGFQHARSKLEAVNRISALTRSGPQVLGPGSKERKSVLVDLAAGLGLDVDTAQNKVALGAAIAARLGARWHDRHWSTGHTITLDGLNALLAAAERRLGLLGQSAADAFSTPADEAAALLVALADAIDTAWDGRTCVEAMRDAEFRHWRQTEWTGWYFEYIGIAALVNAYGGGPRRVRNTSFDYALHSTWDLKAHSVHRDDAAILNDLDAIEAGLAEPGGLGFIVLSGVADYSHSAAFDAWHREQRGAGPAHDRSRALKSGFVPQRLDAFHLPTMESLESARLRGEFTVMAQGRQPDGSPRKPKLKIRLDVARSSGSLVATRTLRTG
ncbi:hypothetical protein [Cellulomonas gilvus]|uniref:Uncharacterized protein n=1 Tax=Cellulomonas gilvus (strain ATCC 13127 / NRRL B-14078) TaxID=593907 RepID=F8A5S2_CELGA|nr:hypothetical protein [Cellulomonas gilvus]AEI13362.1 hypothetical protein Celgi_2869 [Cellulomonas gilvus ATCC 13127]